MIRFNSWKDTNQTIIAPIASLSQGSGSGKSKLATEVIKDGPGFYIVLRSDSSSSGFPKNNFLSELLISLVKEKDSPVVLTDAPFDSVQVGKTLMFFAQITTLYLKDWRALITESIEAHSQTAHYHTLTEEEKETLHFQIARAACSKLGHLFDDNHAITCPSFADIMVEISSKLAYPNNRVEDIALFIFFILNEPALVFVQETMSLGHAQHADQLKLQNQDQPQGQVPSASQREVDSVKNDPAVKAMKKCLDLIPFTIVLDEADQLNGNDPNHCSHGFEQLRRALSYLQPKTNIFFLSLGTRSTVHDLNPEPRDDSKRYTGIRRNLLQPIVLQSNCSVFAKDKYPVEKLKLTFDNLKNPILFKFLATLGHPVWLSTPFESIINLAVKKLKNGSESSGKHVMVLWMIRAGLMANPLDLNTRSLIASQMATLFNLSEDLVRMIVFYPSEPILAMACRRILAEVNYHTHQEVLFSKLEEFFEAIQLDRGQLAEIVGSMTVLLAIDQASKSLSPHGLLEIPGLVRELVDSMDDMKTLWEKKQFVLEPSGSSESQSNSEAADFQDYHVVTVESFIKNLLPPGKFERISAKLPRKTLKGLVNASHTVKLVRTRDGLSFGGESIETMNLPLADNRIGDNNFNLIDDALLKLGLAYQCCFSMPDRYYGYDLIVPVLLEDGSFTFIGIQFKAADVSIGIPVEKMQARFHYVKCPIADKHIINDPSCPRCSNHACPNIASSPEFAHDPGKCDFCIKRQAPSHLFADQICLLISLDPKDAQEFSSERLHSLNGTNFSLIDEACEAFESALLAQPFSGLNHVPVSSSSFMKPLFSIREAIEIDDDNVVNASQSQITNVRGRDRSRSRARGRGRTNSLIRSTAPIGFVIPDAAAAVADNNALDSDGCSLALISSLWDDSYVELPGNQLKITKNKSVQFFNDGYTHRQFCIAIRGIEAFKHLFKPAGSIACAKRLLLAETDFFKRLRNTQNSWNQLSYLKSLLYDAALNYPDANWTLAQWRGWKKLQQQPNETAGVSEIGYKQLETLEESFLKLQVITPFTPSDSVDWIATEILGPNVPTKNPTHFNSLLPSSSTVTLSFSSSYS